MFKASPGFLWAFSEEPSAVSIVHQVVGRKQRAQLSEAIWRFPKMGGNRNHPAILRSVLISFKLTTGDSTWLVRNHNHKRTSKSKGLRPQVPSHAGSTMKNIDGSMILRRTTWTWKILWNPPIFSQVHLLGHIDLDDLGWNETPYTAEAEMETMQPWSSRRKRRPWNLRRPLSRFQVQNPRGLRVSPTLREHRYFENHWFYCFS